MLSKKARPPRILLDYSTLDGLGFSGQHCYVHHLVRGLAALRPPARFLLLGSCPEPPPELAPVFAEPEGVWGYLCCPRREGRGAFYLRHLRLAAVLARAGVHLAHSLHTFSSVIAPCPVVITKHDAMEELFPEYEAWRRSRPYRLDRWAIRHRARRILCSSHTTSQDLRRLWRLPGTCTEVVYLAVEAVPPERRRPPSGWPGNETDAPILASPYNLEPRKNLEALLEAIVILRPEFPSLRLVLFGRAAVTPEREERFARRLLALGLQGAVDRIGFLATEELYWLYRQARVFVFPSLYEGFGLPLLECMAAGGCVVARHASAMQEVVGPAGELTETKDPARLADSVGRLLRDRQRNQALRVSARNRAQEFSVARMAELTWQAYQRALGQDDSR